MDPNKSNQPPAKSGQSARADRLQWWTFAQHWNFLPVVLIGVILTACLDYFSSLQYIGVTVYTAATFGLMLAGAGLLALAKWPAYLAGRFFTFGVKSVPVQLAGCYRWGWRVFLAGMA